MKISFIQIVGKSNSGKSVLADKILNVLSQEENKKVRIINLISSYESGVVHPLKILSELNNNIVLIDDFINPKQKDIESLKTYCNYSLHHKNNSLVLVGHSLHNTCMYGFIGFSSHIVCTCRVENIKSLRTLLGYFHFSKEKTQEIINSFFAKSKLWNLYPFCILNIANRTFNFYDKSSDIKTVFAKPEGIDPSGIPYKINEDFQNEDNSLLNDKVLELKTQFQKFSKSMCNPSKADLFFDLLFVSGEKGTGGAIHPSQVDALFQIYFWSISDVVVVSLLDFINKMTTHEKNDGSLNKAEKLFLKFVLSKICIPQFLMSNNSYKKFIK